jgi:hypothetical protein
MRVFRGCCLAANRKIWRILSVTQPWRLETKCQRPAQPLVEMFLRITSRGDLYRALAGFERRGTC